MAADDFHPQTLPATVVAVWPTGAEPRAVIDVRERGEYILGHVPGSTNISRGQLELRLPELIPVRSVPVVFYCDDTYRSIRAAATAVGLGYTDVSVMEGGLAAWTAAGRELTYGINVIGKDYGERIAVQRQVPQITPEELEDLRTRKNVVVFDVRSPREFEHEGHLLGAHNVPGGELPVAALARTGSTAPPEAIVINCAGRTRSIVAAELLGSMGLDNVMALKNGTMAWLMDGRELETGPETDPLPAADEPARERARELAERLARDHGVASVDSATLRAAQDGDDLLYVLDVRTSAEFEKERIDGAVSCPAGQLTNYLDDKVLVRQAPIVCYSNGHTRAAIAARTLAGIGYPNVRWLHGGLNTWRTACPTAAGPAPFPETETLLITGDGVQMITADALATSGPAADRRIIDIRQSSDFMSGHVPSSIWIPRGDLERRVGRFVFPSQEVVVVSDNSCLARLAACTLKDLGYTGVLVLEGGISSWESAGHPLVEGSDGSEINLLAAREEADLVGFGPIELRRTNEDMVRYLEWEERLGDKYDRPFQRSAETSLASTEG